MPMNHHRRNFVLALILFATWVGILGVMASISGERPQLKNRAGVGR